MTVYNIILPLFTVVMLVRGILQVTGVSVSHGADAATQGLQADAYCDCGGMDFLVYHFAQIKIRSTDPGQEFVIDEEMHLGILFFL